MSQRGYKTPRKVGHVTNMRKAHMNSQRLEKHGQGLKIFTPEHLCINYSFIIGVFMEFLKVLIFIYVYSVLSSCLHLSQKRASDLTINGYEPSFGCWKLKSGRLRKQSLFLTCEPSLPVFMGCLKVQKKLV